MSLADQVAIEMLNSLVKKHKTKFKRKRKLSAAKIKPAVTGGAGVAYGAGKLSGA